MRSSYFYNTGLYESAFSTYYFWKLVFRLSFFYEFPGCNSTCYLLNLLHLWHIFKKTCFKKGSEDFFRKIIYKKKAIFKTRNKRTGNRMRWMRGTRGMFIGIPGNFSEDSGKCYYFNIRGNVEEDSGECSKIFQGMLVKIPGNAREDSREYWQRYSRMLKRTERFNAIQWK